MYSNTENNNENAEERRRNEKKKEKEGLEYPKCFLNTPWGTQGAIDETVSKTAPPIKANEKSSLHSDTLAKKRERLPPNDWVPERHVADGEYEVGTVSSSTMCQASRAIHLYINPFSAIALGHAIGLVTKGTSSCPERRILAPNSKSFGQSLRIRP
ncbi:hypothetical protein PIB30_090477 [Stylosanthes scabra]|uniref:Uncharacterized protein n=1 Tax=Stylosanthes scabra TaxID=79078 RepID=A0ABU6TW94_9FABA|nr:hypothetical protein [Stylosanthes scabra]